MEQAAEKDLYEKYITTRMLERYIRPGDTILDISGSSGLRRRIILIH